MQGTFDSLRSISITVTMHKKSTEVQLFVQQFVRANDKGNTKTPDYWPIVTGIHQWLVDSSHKRPVMRKGFRCQGIISLSRPICVNAPSQRTHDAKLTPLWCQNYVVLTSLWRYHCVGCPMRCHVLFRNSYRMSFHWNVNVLLGNTVSPPAAPKVVIFIISGAWCCQWQKFRQDDISFWAFSARGSLLWIESTWLNVWTVLNTMRARNAASFHQTDIICLGHP